MRKILIFIGLLTLICANFLEDVEIDMPAVRVG